MARQLEHFDNLVSMFLTRAAEKGDAPFVWAKRDGSWRAVKLEIPGTNYTVRSRQGYRAPGS